MGRDLAPCLAVPGPWVPGLTLARCLWAQAELVLADQREELRCLPAPGWEPVLAGDKCVPCGSKARAHMPFLAPSPDTRAQVPVSRGSPPSPVVPRCPRGACLTNPSASTCCPGPSGSGLPPGHSTLSRSERPPPTHMSDVFWPVPTGQGADAGACCPGTRGAADGPPRVKTPCAPATALASHVLGAITYCPLLPALVCVTQVLHQPSLGQRKPAPYWGETCVWALGHGSLVAFGICRCPGTNLSDTEGLLCWPDNASGAHRL